MRMLIENSQEMKEGEVMLWREREIKNRINSARRKFTVSIMYILTITTEFSVCTIKSYSLMVLN